METSLPWQSVEAYNKCNKLLLLIKSTAQLKPYSLGWTSYIILLMLFWFLVIGWNSDPWSLIHPASSMHRATRWRHVCLSWADASTSSQVNPILCKSLFTLSFQFILGLPGLLLNPATSHCRACFGMRASSILVTWPSHRSLLSRITLLLLLLFNRRRARHICAAYTPQGQPTNTTRWVSNACAILHQTMR